MTYLFNWTFDGMFPIEIISFELYGDRGGRFCSHLGGGGFVAVACCLPLVGNGVFFLVGNASFTGAGSPPTLATVRAGLKGKGDVRPVSSAWALETIVFPVEDMLMVGWIVQGQMKNAR
jgi:hypothetical protein